MEQVMDYAKLRCHWRAHPISAAPCGHYFCKVCSPLLQDGTTACPYCEDAWEAADELMSAAPELYC
jgi:hypothetical protein